MSKKNIKKGVESSEGNVIDLNANYRRGNELIAFATNVLINVLIAK